MGDEQFWSLIAVLRGQTDNVAMRRLRKRLVALPNDQLEEFADRLSRAVHDLDTRVHFEQPIRADDFEPDDVDEDLFVAVRCAVVACGREAYDKVLADPAALGRSSAWPIGNGEDLLSAAERAYKDRTGQSWTYVPAWNTETGDNMGGWPEVGASLGEPDKSKIAAVPETIGSSRSDENRLIDFDFSFVDDVIARLWDKESWSSSLIEAAKHAQAAVLADAELMEDVASAGLKIVSVTVEFVSAKARPTNRVKRRGKAAEVTLGRRLPKKEALDAVALTSWLETYFRDSVELVLARTGKGRR